MHQPFESDTTLGGSSWYKWENKYAQKTVSDGYIIGTATKW